MKLNRRNILKSGLAFSCVSSINIHAQAMSNLTGIDTKFKNVVFFYDPFGVPDIINNWIPNDDMTLKPANAPLESIKQYCRFYKNVGKRLSIPSVDHTSLNTTFNEDTLDQKVVPYFSNGNDSHPLYFASANPASKPSRANSIFTPFINELPKAVKYVNDLIATPNTTTLEHNVQQFENVLNENINIVDRDTMRLHKDEIVNQINELKTVQCQPVVQSNLTSDSNIEMSKPYIDLSVSTMSCGLTNFSFIAIGSSDGDLHFYENGMLKSMSASASRNETATYLEGARQVSEQFAYLIDQLMKTNDQNGDPLFNSTLVVKFSNVGELGNPDQERNIPFVLSSGHPDFPGNQIVDADGSHANVLNEVIDLLDLEDEVNYYSI